MGQPIAIGLDVGLSTTKAVAFTTDGEVVAAACRESVNSLPRPRWVERDPQAFRTMVLDVLADLVGQLGRREIAGVSLTAHGDGVWVLGPDGEILRPGILSLDSRAREQAATMSDGERGRRLAELAGQLPMSSSAGPELRWLKENEPDTYRRIRWILFTKDVVRYWLTGEVGQDFTEASSGFTSVATQKVSPEALEVMGIPELAGCIPPIRQSLERGGAITAEVAGVTGIPEGTMVATGLHDIVAGSVGAGAVRPGDASVVAGSFCVNQYITDVPLTGDWMTRSFTAEGSWNLITASPSSSTNLDWYAHVMVPELVAGSRAAGTGDFGFLDGLLQDLEPLAEGSPYYLPFLFGSPLPVDASAGIVGLRAWHTRADVVRSVLEGIAHNHRHHLDRLPIPDTTVPKVMGGVSRNRLWSQMLANTLGREIEITATPEPGAMGAAMAAFVAAGVFPDTESAVSAMVGTGLRVAPDDGAAGMQQRYERYRELLDAMSGWWGVR
jgi:L-xylulokinase